MKKIILSVLLVLSLLLSTIILAECYTKDITPTKPDSLYTDHGDGTITDNETGLMWQKCTLGLAGDDCSISTVTNADADAGLIWQGALTLTWQAALEFANDNTDFGYDDWRLPNRNELFSLVRDGCRIPAINSVLFPNTLSSPSYDYWRPNTSIEYYWSSSPLGNINEYAWGTDVVGLYAWAVDFGYGDVSSSYKDYAWHYVRLVRQ